MTTGAEPSAIYSWVATNGQIVYFFAQIAYWAVVGFAAVWAAFLLKRLVDFKTGAAKAVKDEVVEAAEETKASVDSFVE